MNRWRRPTWKAIPDSRNLYPLLAMFTVVAVLVMGLLVQRILLTDARADAEIARAKLARSLVQNLDTARRLDDALATVKVTKAVLSSAYVCIGGISGALAVTAQPALALSRLEAVKAPCHVALAALKGEP